MKLGRACALAVSVLTVLLVAVGPGAAERLAPPSRQDQLRQLTKEAAALSKAYRGEIQALEEAKLAAKRADARAEKVAKDLKSARVQVAQIAQTTYMGAKVDTTMLLAFNGDVQEVLGQVATLEHLARNKREQISRMHSLSQQAIQAQEAADERVVQLKKDIAELRAKKNEVERYLAKHGYQSPSGANGLTARMQLVRDLTLQQFPMPYGYGCLRPGDSGEHGVGRACDFMLSSGGRVPNAADNARGDAIAQYYIENGQRLGIMYIIWRQRYYDIRTGTGWKMMSNRGGNTANHIDHVHVSVL
ncbi:coiled-coil domain-containing protein [Rhizohabitans arisaemae]|uniref:coiled-coil domain-containing protein n=1 Tax=Rhizohabitans arisaemae TaxID=2720610 RepID=UPI0024B0A169|nr:hypothetical protein [Rhizohabitans arisaemae]